MYKNRRANSKGRTLYEMNKHQQTNILPAMRVGVKKCKAKIWLVKAVGVKKRKRMLPR